MWRYAGATHAKGPLYGDTCHGLRERFGEKYVNFVEN